MECPGCHQTWQERHVPQSTAIWLLCPGGGETEHQHGAQEHPGSCRTWQELGLFAKLFVIWLLRTPECLPRTIGGAGRVLPRVLLPPEAVTLPCLMGKPVFIGSSKGVRELSHRCSSCYSCFWISGQWWSLEELTWTQKWLPEQTDLSCSWSGASPPGLHFYNLITSSSS